MPVFYFDFRNAAKDSRDESGTLFQSVKEARAAAIKLLPDIAQEELPDGDQHVFSVRVRDEDGRYIFHASLTLVAQDLI